MESAAILAGGRATRFGGRDKGALLVGGQTILERQVAELSLVTNDILIVGVHTGDRTRAVQALARAGHAVARVVPRTITDVVPGCGPLGGIHAVLTEARGNAVFVAACDMPYLNAAFISFLLSLTREADAVVPRTEGGYHPLCAAYTRACLKPVARRLADRQLKTIDLLMDVRTRIVTPEELDRFGGERKLLANINTPAEYAGLAALHDHMM
jgi:molybdopterin-guanine dinucleotide biosynthesis protein A